MRTIYLKVEVDSIDPQQNLAVGTLTTLQKLLDAAGSDLVALTVKAPPNKIPSPEYIAVLHQPGGCDYTIGCGIQVANLEAKTYGGALVEAGELLTEYTEERKLDSLTVYEVTRSMMLNTQGIYKKMRAEKAAAEVARRETIEREQLAKLQAKYGKG